MRRPETEPLRRRLSHQGPLGVGEVPVLHRIGDRHVVHELAGGFRGEPPTRVVQLRRDPRPLEFPRMRTEQFVVVGGDDPLMGVLVAFARTEQVLHQSPHPITPLG